MRPLAVLALVLALAVPAGAPAQTTTAPTREQALADLGRSDLEARRQAAAWMGEVGRMEDVPALVKVLRDPDPVVRALGEHALWQVWSRSGDSEIDALFQQGVDQMTQRDGPAAIATFSRIIEKRPEFAEGWNKRATVYFLMGEYEKSLADCDEVVKRNPSHFGALSGYGQIYLQLNKPDRALAYFERALAVNPNLEQVERMIEELKGVLMQRKKDTI
jgi:tetratricopeptide (TPR) repeat protein